MIFINNYLKLKQLLKRLLLGPLFGVLLYGLGGVQAQASRIATFNTHNYGLVDRVVDGQFYTQYPKPEAEKKALQAVILRVQPDILALQEIGDLSFLEELQADLKRQGLDYPYAILSPGPDPQRQLAVLTKLEPIKTRTYPQIALKYFKDYTCVRRGMLELWFKENEKTWALYVVHLKSRYPSQYEKDLESKQLRKGEAYALRNKIQSLIEPITPYLIVGDFNDHPYSPPLKAFLKKQGTVLTHMLDAHDSRQESWTFHHAKMGVYSRLDYILASPPMLPYIQDHVAHIEDILPHSLKASDHRLIYVDLSL